MPALRGDERVFMSSFGARLYSTWKQFEQSDTYHYFHHLRTPAGFSELAGELGNRLVLRWGSSYRVSPLGQILSPPHDDTVFIFGCGWSLNEIPPEEYRRMERHATLGFSAFALHQKFLRLDYQILKEVYIPEDTEGKVRRLNDIREHLHKTATLHQNTRWILHRTPFTCILSSLLREKVIPEGSNISFFSKVRRGHAVKPSTSLSEGLAHATTTVTMAVDLAQLMGFKTIVLVGIDLYDQRYFFLRSEELHPNLRSQLGDAPVSQPHKTADRMLKIIPAWSDELTTRGVGLFVYNPRSLLAQCLPVWRWT